MATEQTAYYLRDGSGTEVEVSADAAGNVVFAGWSWFLKAPPGEVRKWIEALTAVVNEVESGGNGHEKSNHRS